MKEEESTTWYQVLNGFHCVGCALASEPISNWDLFPSVCIVRHQNAAWWWALDWHWNGLQKAIFQPSIQTDSKEIIGYLLAALYEETAAR